MGKLSPWPTSSLRRPSTPCSPAPLDLNVQETLWGNGWPAPSAASVTAAPSRSCPTTNRVKHVRDNTSHITIVFGCFFLAFIFSYTSPLLHICNEPLIGPGTGREENRKSIDLGQPDLNLQDDNIEEVNDTEPSALEPAQIQRFLIKDSIIVCSFQKP